MPVTPYVIEDFGGYNVADDPEEVGLTGATGILDVDFDRRGRIRTRNGFVSVTGFVATLTGSTLAGLATFETTGGLKQAVVGYANGATKKYEAYSSTGTLVASATPAATSISAARIGTPTNEYLYIANGADSVWRWTGAAWSQPAGMPVATHLTGKPNSNRLVAANITGTSVSRVQFSDAGAPETWGVNNFVDLAPGDGSAVTGLATWQNDVYAFKRRRFFVFGTEGLSGTGAPTFPYRGVDGYGAIIPPVAGDEGVFFFDGRSVWLTTGGIPQRISRPVEPALRGEVPLVGFSNATVDLASLTIAALSYSLGRLYMSVVVSSGVRVVFVYDPKIDKWTVYGQDLWYFATLRRSGTDQEYVYAFGNVTGNAGVYYLDPTAYADGVGGASVINWYYLTGDYALGPPERVSTIGYTGVIGNITDAGSIPNVGVAIRTDMAAVSGNAAFTSTAPVNALGDREAWVMADCEGRRWQLQLSGTGGFYISRVVHEITLVKDAGVM